LFTLEWTHPANLLNTTTQRLKHTDESVNKVQLQRSWTKLDHCLLWKTLATFVYSTEDNGLTIT